MNELMMSESWFGAVLLIGAVVLIGLFTAQFIRGSWDRKKMIRLHVFPKPHVSAPSRH